MDIHVIFDIVKKKIRYWRKKITTSDLAYAGATASLIGGGSFVDENEGFI